MDDNTFNLSNASFNGSQVQLGNENAQYISTSKEQLAAQQVAELLAYLENQIQNLEALPEADRKKSVKRLGAAKAEVEETEPNKESIAKELKRVNESLTEASKTTKGVKEFITEVAPTVAKIAGWLGYAVGSIWMV